MSSNSTTRPLHPVPLGKLMLIGAGIALIPIIFFLASGEPNPAWPKFWMLRPLIIVPFAGAMGGLCYYFMDYLRYQGGWRKILANILSVIIFIFGLWIGSVLGLDGTYWD